MGDSDHPITEIGVEVEEIYFTMVAQARRTVQILESWQSQPDFGSDNYVTVTWHCPARGIEVRDNKQGYPSQCFPSLTQQVRQMRSWQSGIMFCEACRGTWGWAIDPITGMPSMNGRTERIRR